MKNHFRSEAVRTVAAPQNPVHPAKDDVEHAFVFFPAKQGRTMLKLVLTILLSIVLAGCWAGSRQKGRGPQLALTRLSLEELMNLQVITVSKKAEDATKAAAAVFVITQEDIRRSGVTSIAEALRLVPGMEVSRLDASQWAITSRGFNGPFANKLAVLIDGRSVYTPLFSGVYWEAQDVLLDDVERIEVIRGPGATLWGANAVNGIINILTRSAKNTSGGLFTSGTGSEERGFGSLRYGGALGNNAWSRAYAKFSVRDNLVDPTGKEAADGWDILQGGFRMDWEASPDNSVTLQGDLYDGDLGHTLTAATVDSPYARTMKTDVNMTGANVLGRWKRGFSESSDLALQLYYDWNNRGQGFLQERRGTFDLDFQHRFGLSDRHEILWGLGYRFTRDRVFDSAGFSFNRKTRDFPIYSAFVQDEIILMRDRMLLKLGSRFEDHEQTGLEIQPSARFALTPDDRQTFWAAVSRAVRMPARTENDLQWVLRTYPPDAMWPGSPVGVVTLVGNPNFSSERLLAYELGYRLRPAERFSFDLAMYYNTYDDLRTMETGPPSGDSTLWVIPFWADNKMEGNTYGLELSANWQLRDWWRLRPIYSYLRVQLDRDPDSQHTLSQNEEWVSPRHQFSFSSLMDLPGRLELDVRFRYVDKLPSLVEQYTSLDLRVGWQPVNKLEIAVIGQNLLDDHHVEFVPPIRKYFKNPAVPDGARADDAPALFDILSSAVERGVYGKIAWRF